MIRGCNTTNFVTRKQMLEKILGNEARVAIDLPEHGQVWLNRVDSKRFLGSYDLTSSSGRFLFDNEAKIVYASISESVDGVKVASSEQIKIFQENADVRDRAADELLRKLQAKQITG